jgi:orotate phosphoribosyltransferase
VCGPLFRTGDFTLRSGAKSRWRIECEALTSEDWHALALMASEILPPFGAVEGVPRGGLAFALALRRYGTSGPVLIAGDVVTTGGSMERARAGRDAVGVAVFARGVFPSWVTPLFVMGGRIDRA